MNPAGNGIAGWLYRGAKRDPDRLLVHSIEQDKAITWGQMASISRRIGQYLAARDIVAGDRIVLLSGNSIEHLAVYIGVMAYGATICTIQVEMNAAHLAEIFAAIGPKFIIAESGVDLGDTEIIELGDWQPGVGSGFFADIAELPDEPLEPVNGELLGAADTPPAVANNDDERGRSRYRWWGPWYEHQNLRDERAEAFSSRVWGGVYTYSYLAQATTPGHFVVPPTKAEEMYAPETFGRSASDRLIVE